MGIADLLSRGRAHPVACLPTVPGKAATRSAWLRSSRYRCWCRKLSSPHPSIHHCPARDLCPPRLPPRCPPHRSLSSCSLQLGVAVGCRHVVGCQFSCSGPLVKEGTAPLQSSARECSRGGGKRGAALAAQCQFEECRLRRRARRGRTKVVAAVRVGRKYARIWSSGNHRIKCAVTDRCHCQRTTSSSPWPCTPPASIASASTACHIMVRMLPQLSCNVFIVV